MLAHGADCEARGSCEFDGDTLENVPALWAASAAGHFTIVQTLVMEGANVNARTKTNSTPLRAACFDGHSSIVSYLLKRGADPEIANRYGHTCLMIACYKGHKKCVDLLLKHEIDINKRSNKGTTALHDAAESNNVEIFRTLFRKGAKFLTNELGVSPLITAALGGHEQIVNYFGCGDFIKDTTHGGYSLSNTVTKAKIAEAVELLGCYFVDKSREFAKGVEHWIWANMIRGSDPIEIAEPKPAFDNMQELNTAEALRLALSDRHRIKMNSLLIRERVLGRRHPEVSFYIRYRGAVYADAGSYERCIILWKYALEMQISTSNKPVSLHILSSLHSFVDLFSVMEAKNCPPPMENLFFVWEHLMQRFSEIQDQCTPELSKEDLDEREKQFSHLRCIVLLVLSKMMKRLSENNSCEQRKAVMSDLRRLVFINDEKNQLLIHLACQDFSDQMPDKHCRSRKNSTSFPNAAVVETLIKAGSPVDEATGSGDRPITLAAKYGCLKTIDVLLKNGAHISFTNGEGNNIFTILRLTASRADRLKLISKHCPFPLKCIAAREVAHQLIASKDIKVPYYLEPFVLAHKPHVPSISFSVFADYFARPHMPIERNHQRILIALIDYCFIGTPLFLLLVESIFCRKSKRERKAHTKKLIMADGDAVPSTIDIGFAFVATRKFANETFTNGLTSQLQSAIGSESSIDDVTNGLDPYLVNMIIITISAAAVLALSIYALVMTKIEQERVREKLANPKPQNGLHKQQHAAIATDVIDPKEPLDKI
ncbi:Oidioi.mRNA.OKI2018_I69.XSR.g16389.t1.cds [Oikopleura dioica]|uniref:Oidioi.mRNA.OKI2018_I69.XSR.g16389.t1.cds n=1 Tax=Oikopleura dioica TaxID=34765 RepID=A0ABN7SL18_OIKDI|nr:Oidioi.mRNA.OKI2018_I69.XSR.g16389.t1.cds [Oikopleura dioica]